jgi:hypothetical protein
MDVEENTRLIVMLAEERKRELAQAAGRKV